MSAESWRRRLRKRIFKRSKELRIEPSRHEVETELEDLYQMEHEP